MNLKQYPNIYPDLMDLIHLFVFFNPESASDTEENSNVVIWRVNLFVNFRDVGLHSIQINQISKFKCQKHDINLAMSDIKGD